MSELLPGPFYKENGQMKDDGVLFDKQRDDEFSVYLAAAKILPIIKDYMEEKGIVDPTMEKVDQITESLIEEFLKD